jgi:hypothetical protein
MSATEATDGARATTATEALARYIPTPVRDGLDRLATLERRSGGRASIVAGAVLVGLLLVLQTVAYMGNRHYTRFSDLAMLGSQYAQRIGQQDLAVDPHGIGYDGQFYYYIASDPTLVVRCAHDTAGCPIDDPALRSSRILYPITARIVALNQPVLVPYTLYLVNFVAILVTVVLVGFVCVKAGASGWLGAAAGLFSGMVLGLLRDLADPFAVMWAVLAVWLLVKRRYLLAAAAVAAALLTREQLLLFLPLLFVPLVVERRWRTLAQCALIALTPFVAWQLVLRVVYGRWPLLSSVGSASAGSDKVLPLPFAGLLVNHGGGEFRTIVVFVAIPIAFTALVAALALRERGPRSLLVDTLPAVVLLYCLAISLTSPAQWAEIWSPARLAAPGVVLGVVVAGQSRQLPRALTLLYALAVASFGIVISLSALAPAALNFR